MLAVLQGKPVDRAPVAPAYIQLYLATEVRRHALADYQAVIGDRQEIPLDPAQEVSIQTRAIRAAWASLGVTPDWIWSTILPPANWLAECVLRREGERLWRIHLPSGEREELSALVLQDDQSYGRWERPLPHGYSEVDELVPPLTTGEILTGGTLAVTRQLLLKMGDQAFVTPAIATPFWKCYYVLGFQGLMTMPHDNPDLFHYLLERQTLNLCARARAYAKLGVHGVFVEECMTSADLLSPRDYEEFVFPYSRTLLDEFRALGTPMIYYITGDIVPRLSRLIELAPDALGVEESKKGFRIDLAEIAASVGDRMAVLGNLDATRVKDWDDQELAHQIKQQVEAARPARGFIASMGSPFPLDTPRERVQAFIATAQILSASERSQDGTDHGAL
jgi:uroporphyrinogen decarboxylase